MEAKNVLVIVAVAMLALVIGQAQAELIEVPNGDFQTLYEPGTTSPATIEDGTYFGIDQKTIKGPAGAVATYADGSTGTGVELPGWVIADKDNADIMQAGTWGGPDGPGDCAFLCFAGWGGPTTIVSAEPLSSVPFGLTYKLSGMIYSAGRPIVLELLVDDVVQTPDTSDIPAASEGWTEMSNTYSSIPAGDVKILLGTRDYAGDGWTGNRASIDNVTFEVFGLMYPSPEHGETVLTDENLELSWTNLPNDGNDVYVDVWFGTEPNELHPGYDMTLIVDAGENTDAKIVDASVEDTYYWQVNSYLNGAGAINDSNMLEGGLWLFYAVSDIAPTVEIVTLDQMTWTGEGVPIDATVTDDAASALTIAWTADLPTGLTASFDPVDAADTTVTLTKVPYSEAKIANPSFEMVTEQSAITTSRDTWGHYDRPAGGTAYALQYVPNTTYHFPEDENTPPDGNIICRTATAIGESRADGLATILDEKFDPSANYTLTVAVGHPHAVPDDPAYNDDTWRGYLVQLVAGGEVESTGSGADNISGGTVIAEDDNGLTIAPRTWETSTVTYTPGSEFAELAGQPLQIRLLAVDDPDPEYFSQTKVFYDNVVLTADPGFPTTGIQTVTMTVTVGDVATPTSDTASIEIDVYDDACHMARVAEGKSAITDFNGNCITGLEDLAVIAAAWLDDYAVTGPVGRP